MRLVGLKPSLGMRLVVSLDNNKNCQLHSSCNKPRNNTTKELAVLITFAVLSYDEDTIKSPLDPE